MVARLTALGHEAHIIERTLNWWGRNLSILDNVPDPEAFYDRFSEMVYMATPHTE